jgi:hypothetical protein
VTKLQDGWPRKCVRFQRGLKDNLFEMNQDQPGPHKVLLFPDYFQHLSYGVRPEYFGYIYVYNCPASDMKFITQLQMLQILEYVDVYLHSQNVFNFSLQIIILNFVTAIHINFKENLQYSAFKNRPLRRRSCVKGTLHTVMYDNASV